MNILYGLYKPDEGEILIRGKKAAIHTPNDAIALGIGMVHQHFMLVPVMTVTENVMLGNEPTRRRSIPGQGQRGGAHPGNLEPIRAGGRSGFLRPGPFRGDTAAS